MDPIVRMQWRLKIKKPFPEAWSVLLGDILTNLRGALDHAMWSAVAIHSGPPAKPQQVQFPICTKANDFPAWSRKLEALVSRDVWSIVDALQPFHGGDQAYTSPLDIVRWLSNIDKHRSVHIVGRTYFDLESVHVRSESPVEIVEERHHEGPVEGDNKTVLFLKFKRPQSSAPVDVVPTFAFSPSIRISESPEEHRTLTSAMEAMTNGVLRVITLITGAASLTIPDSDSLDLGEENELVAPEFGGNVYTFRDHEGVIHRFNLPTDQTAEPDVRA